MTYFKMTMLCAVLGLAGCEGAQEISDAFFTKNEETNKSAVDSGLSQLEGGGIISAVLATAAGAWVMDHKNKGRKAKAAEAVE